MKTKVKILSISLALFSFTSCDSIENLLLSDAEILTKEMGGTWKLQTVREETLFSSVGGDRENYGHTFDSTYVASGDLVITPSDDNKTYTGSIQIVYSDWNESVPLTGNCTKANTVAVKEGIYLISDSIIQSLFMYSPSPATYIQGIITDRTKDGFKLNFEEFSYDYGYLKKRTLVYVK